MYYVYYILCNTCTCSIVVLFLISLFMKVFGTIAPLLTNVVKFYRTLIGHPFSPPCLAKALHPHRIWLIPASPSILRRTSALSGTLIYMYTLWVKEEQLLTPIVLALSFVQTQCSLYVIFCMQQFTQCTTAAFRMENVHSQLRRKQPVLHSMSK